MKEPPGTHFLPILIGGFALLIILLMGAAWTGIEALQTAGTDANNMVEQQRGTLLLTDQVQREEGALSAIFYDLAAGAERGDRAVLLRRLDQAERDLHRTTAAGLASPPSPEIAARWSRVRSAADAFIREGRATLLSGRTPSQLFYRTHQELIDALAELSTLTFASDAAAGNDQHERFRRRLRYAFTMLGAALVLALAGASGTTHHVSRMFRSLEWQAAELARLSSRSMAEQEESARRFSRELHDHMGQTLNAIEANLVALQHARRFDEGRIEDCLGLIKDAIGNVREVAQLLRPSILDDFGLDPGLRWLSESFAERTGIAVNYQSEITGRLPGDTETQLFRIAQEALTNVGRHSGATKVDVKLGAHNGHVVLTVADNGRGFRTAPRPGGMGLMGMRARARNVNGDLDIQSSSGGVSITARLPKPSTDES